MEHIKRRCSRALSASAAAALATLLATQAACAEEAAVEPEKVPQPAPERASRWYGWQNLAADGAALALVATAISLEQRQGSPSSALAYGALGTYALGGPIIHLIHQNYGRSAASVGMRVGGPIVLGALGAAAEDCGNHGGEFCGLGGALLGASLGVVAAVAVDAAVLAYDDAPEAEAAAPTLRIGFNRTGVVAFGSF